MKVNIACPQCGQFNVFTEPLVFVLNASCTGCGVRLCYRGNGEIEAVSPPPVDQDADAAARDADQAGQPLPAWDADRPVIRVERDVVGVPRMKQVHDDIIAMWDTLYQDRQVSELQARREAAAIQQVVRDAVTKSRPVRHFDKADGTGYGSYIRLDHVNNPSLLRPFVDDGKAKIFIPSRLHDADQPGPPPVLSELTPDVCRSQRELLRLMRDNPQSKIVERATEVGARIAEEIERRILDPKGADYIIVDDPVRLTWKRTTDAEPEAVKNCLKEFADYVMGLKRYLGLSGVQPLDPQVDPSGVVYVDAFSPANYPPGTRAELVLRGWRFVWAVQLPPAADDDCPPPTIVQEQT